MQDLSESSYRSLAAENFRSASKKFVTRDFGECWQLLEPLTAKSTELVKSDQISVKTRTKIWMLYGALVDRGLEGSGSVANLSSRINGQIWDDLRQGFDGTLSDQVSPEIMLTFTRLVVKYHGNTKQTIKAIEEYLSHQHGEANAGQKELVRLLVLDVLPAEGDFDYSRELLTHSEIFNESEKVVLSASLKVKEQQAAEELTEQRKEKERVEKLERDRVQKAIAAASESPQASGSKREAEGQESAKSESKNQVSKPRPRQSLPAYWRDWLTSTLASRGFTNAVLVLLLLCSFGLNRRVRTRVADVGRWVYESAKHAAKMGLTVTYF